MAELKIVDITNMTLGDIFTFVKKLLDADSISVERAYVLVNIMCRVQSIRVNRVDIFTALFPTVEDHTVLENMYFAKMKRVIEMANNKGMTLRETMVNIIRDMVSAAYRTWRMPFTDYYSVHIVSRVKKPVVFLYADDKQYINMKDANGHYTNVFHPVGHTLFDAEEYAKNPVKYIEWFSATR